MRFGWGMILVWIPLLFLAWEFRVMSEQHVGLPFSHRALWGLTALMLAVEAGGVALLATGLSKARYLQSTISLLSICCGFLTILGLALYLRSGIRS
jgi:hypothetical protein